MRIKNLTSNASNQAIFCIFTLFLVCVFIDLTILFIALNSGITFKESFDWIFSSFCEVNFEMKFIYIILLILPFVWLFFLVNQLKAKMSDDRIAYELNFIKYIDFEDNRIKLVYLKTNEIREISYKDIDFMELIINTGLLTGRPISIVKELCININSDSYSFSIRYSPVDFNKLFKIIYYSQYMNRFSYRFTGTEINLQKALQKTINDYIKNNYKKTFGAYLYAPHSNVLAIIIVFIFVTFMLFIYILFK